MQKLSGFSLITVIFIITVLLVMGTALSKTVFNSMSAADNKISSLKAFYLAEAGIEEIKYELKKNPNWYTDLPRSPADDVDWIISGSKGRSRPAPTGSYKIIREYKKDRAYAVGKSKKSVRIIKIEQKNWGML